MAGILVHWIASRRTLVALTAYWFGLAIHWGILSTVALPALVERFVPAAVKTTALAVASALDALVAIVVQPIAGAVSDHATSPWGRRRPFIVIGVVAQLVFLALLAQAGSYLVLLVALLLVETASNIAQGPYQGLLPDLVPDRDRGLASGLLGAALLSGQVLGVAAAGLAAGAGRLDLAIGTAALGVGLGAVVTVVGTEEAATGVGPSFGFRRGALARLLRPAAWRLPVRTIILDVWGRDVLSHRDYLWVLASRLAILMATGTLQPFAYFYLEDALDLGNQAGPAVIPLAALVAVVALLSAVPGGALTNRWGRIRTVLVSAISGAVGAVFFAVAPSYGWLFWVAVPFGFALGVFLAADWALLVDVVPPDEAGRYLGLSNTVTAGSGLLAIAVGGPLADVINGWGATLGWGGGAGYRAVFLLAALEFLVGAWCVTRVGEPGRATGPASRPRLLRPSVLGWRAHPPRILDPLLVTWDRIDRRRRGIRSPRAGAVLGVELRRHRGRPVRLADGTIVEPGAPIGEIHLDNERVREVVARSGVGAGIRAGTEDLTAVVRWAGDLPPGERPVAYHGTTLLVPFARRFGWEVHQRRPGVWPALQDWYLRWLMAQFSVEGRRRLARGRRPLRSAEVWISGRQLEERFGSRREPRGAG